jgi:hypothetical protein
MAKVVGQSNRSLRGVPRGVQIGDGGKIVITRSELFMKFNVPAGTTGDYGVAATISPGAKPLGGGDNVFAFLYRLANCYTRLKWEYMCFEFRPAVGTTQSGIITYGIRYMDDRTAPKAPTNRAEVQALYPVNDHPIWQGDCLEVNKDLLMTRKWYATQPITGAAAADSIDLGPGTFEACCSATIPASGTTGLFAGEFWVTYRCVLDGTRSEN